MSRDEPYSPDKFPMHKSSERGTTHGYILETRVAPGGGVACVGGFTFGVAWVPVPIAQVQPPYGVPASDPVCALAGSPHLLTYDGAKALMHWFLAAKDQSGIGTLHVRNDPIQVRIVRVKLEYSSVETRVGWVECVDTTEWRHAPPLKTHDPNTEPADAPASEGKENGND